MIWTTCTTAIYQLFAFFVFIYQQHGLLHLEIKQISSITNRDTATMACAPNFDDLRPCKYCHVTMAISAIVSNVYLAVRLFYKVRLLLAIRAQLRRLALTESARAALY